MVLKYMETPIPNIQERLDLVIATYIAKTGSAELVDQSSIATFFHICDDIYFDGLVSKTLAQHKSKLTLIFDENALEKHETSAGYQNLSFNKKQALIFINKKFLNKEFLFGVRKYRYTGGRRCYNLLECFRDVFLHELTHLVFALIRTASGKARPGITFDPSMSGFFKDIEIQETNHTESFLKVILHLYGQTVEYHQFTKKNEEFEEKESRERSARRKEREQMRKETVQERDERYERMRMEAQKSYIDQSIEDEIEKLGPDMSSMILKKDITKDLKFSKEDFSIGQKLKLGDGKQWTITKLNEKSLALEMGGERKRFPYTSVHFLFYNYIYAMKRKIDKSPERIIDLT
jgi:hypothetical protein